MDHWTTLAQRQADVIKRRRHAVSDLRLVAELIDDGLPIPLAIHPARDGLRVQVHSQDVPDWLLVLNLPVPAWTPAPVGGGEHLEVTASHLGTPFTLVAFRRSVAEVCS